MKDLLKAILMVFFGLILIGVIIEYVLPFVLFAGLIYFIYWMVTNSNKPHEKKPKGISQKIADNVPYFATAKPNMAPVYASYQQTDENFLERINQTFKSLEIEYTSYESNSFKAVKIQEMIESRDLDIERFFDLLNRTRVLIDNANYRVGTKTHAGNVLTAVEVGRIQSSVNVLYESWSNVKRKLDYAF